MISVDSEDDPASTMNGQKKSLFILTAIGLILLSFPIHRHRPGRPEPAIPTIPPTGKTSGYAAPPANAGPRHYRPEPATESVQRRADEVIRRHQGMSKKEFEKSAELQELGRRFFGHLDSPDFQKRLNETIDLMKSTKGVDHGTLSFGLDDFSSPNARAWLEAALSDDPERARNYMMNLLEGAVFEFALDPAAETTSNGLTVKGAGAAPDTAPRE